MMMMKQEMFSKYLTVWNSYDKDHRNRLTFLNELQSIFPFNEKTFRKHWWTIQETVVNYYGLDSEKVFSTLDSYCINTFLCVIDSESIQELLKNHLGHPVCRGIDYVLVNQFVPFLEKKKVPVPIHFLRNGDETDNESETPIRKRMRKESYRINMMQNAAQLFWEKEKKIGKSKFTSPSTLARSKDMNDLVDMINKIGDLSPISGDEHSKSGVDPEWFSAYFPGDKKPGPKSKN
jgi:hypothetical protein